MRHHRDGAGTKVPDRGSDGKAFDRDAAQRAGGDGCIDGKGDDNRTDTAQQGAVGAGLEINGVNGRRAGPIGVGRDGLHHERCGGVSDGVNRAGARRLKGCGYGKRIIVCNSRVAHDRQGQIKSDASGAAREILARNHGYGSGCIIAHGGVDRNSFDINTRRQGSVDDKGVGGKCDNNGVRSPYQTAVNGNVEINGVGGRIANGIRGDEHRIDLNRSGGGEQSACSQEKSRAREKGNNGKKAKRPVHDSPV